MRRDLEAYAAWRMGQIVVRMLDQSDGGIPIKNQEKLLKVLIKFRDRVAQKGTNLTSPKEYLLHLAEYLRYSAEEIVSGRKKPTSSSSQEINLSACSLQPDSVIQWRQFHQAVAALPQEDRNVFLLKWYWDATDFQVATLLEQDESEVPRTFLSGGLKLALGPQWRRENEIPVEATEADVIDLLLGTTRGSDPESMQLAQRLLAISKLDTLLQVKVDLAASIPSEQDSRSRFEVPSEEFFRCEKYLDRYATSDEFLAAIQEARLLDPNEYEAYSQEGQTRSVRELAHHLIRRGLLTSFQLRAIEHAKTRGLRMGQYIVLDKVGEGGMGHVFRARHCRMNRVVALKVLSRQAMENPKTVQRFFQEVEAAARLTHPNIVTAYDAGESEGLHFLVMELVQGRDLGKVVAEDGPMSVHDAVKAIKQAATGLAYAHEKGLVHRDIKPDNMLLDENRNVRILDMGIARLVDTAEIDSEGKTHDSSLLTVSGSRNLTMEGTVMGTVAFMPPEQTVDSKQVDQRADLYSLGCTLYYLLSGKPPFEEQTVRDMVMAHRQKDPPRIRALRDDVPAELDLLILKCMAKSPEQRFSNCDELIADLEKFDSELASSSLTAEPEMDRPASPSPQPASPAMASGPPPSPRPPGTSQERLRSMVRRKRITRYVTLGGLLVVAALVFVVARPLIEQQLGTEEGDAKEVSMQAPAVITNQESKSVEPAEPVPTPVVPDASSGSSTVPQDQPEKEDSPQPMPTEDEVMPPANVPSQGAGPFAPKPTDNDEEAMVQEAPESYLESELLSENWIDSPSIRSGPIPRNFDGTPLTSPPQNAGFFQPNDMNDDVDALRPDEVFRLDMNQIDATDIRSGNLVRQGHQIEHNNVLLLPDPIMGQVARFQNSKLNITPALIGQKDSYTLCMWFKPQRYAGSEGWARVFGENGTSYLFGIAIHRDGRVRLNTWDKDFVEANQDTEPGVIKFGQWNFVAVSVSNAPSQNDVGPDGSACATVFTQDGFDLNSYSLNAFKTGMPTRTSSLGPLFFRGDIANLSVYDKALTEDEVTQVMVSSERLAKLPKVPSASDMFDLRNGAVIIDHSPTNNAGRFDIEYMFGKPGVAQSTHTNVDDAATIFSDTRVPANYVEFRTARPILLRRIALVAAHDKGNASRAFSEFSLLAANPATGKFETVVFQYWPSLPYSTAKSEGAITIQPSGEDTLKLIADVTPVAAQVFRAEFVEETAANKTSFRGPRIIELDGFE